MSSQKDPGPSPSKKAKVVSEPEFNKSSSIFTDLVKRNTFVDKSRILKDLVKAGESSNKLLSAARRLGKSTILDMCHDFFGMKIDEDGKVIPKENFMEKNDFVDHKLEICQEKDFFQNHFSSYPVMTINLKTVSGNSYEQVIIGFQMSLRDCFLAHEYLTCSDSLNEEEKQMFRKYISPISCLELPEEVSRNGLKYLSQVLYKHFKQQVVVLIDEYDHPMNSAILENVAIEKINNFFRRVYSDVFKENNIRIMKTGVTFQIVKLGIITGISRFVDLGLSGINNFEEFQFLGNHNFVKYYGFTEAEVDQLLDRFTSDSEEFEKKKNEINKFYNGYIALNGMKVLNSWSILCYLCTGELKSHWSTSGVAMRLTNAVHAAVIRFSIEKLLMNKTLIIQYTDKLSISELNKLIYICKLEKSDDFEVASPDLYLSVLLQQGYLACAESGKLDMLIVSIPNEEIRTEFRKCLKNHYGQRVRFLMERCAGIINKLSPKWNNKNYEEFLEKYRAYVLVAHKNLLRKNEAAYHAITFNMLAATEFTIGTEINFSNGRPDIVAVTNEGLGIVIEMKYNQTIGEALQQIVDKYNTFFSSIDIPVNRKIHFGINITSSEVINLGVMGHDCAMSKAKYFNLPATSNSKPQGKTNGGSSRKRGRK